MEQPQGQPLVQFDLLDVPLLLQRAVVVQNPVDHVQDVARPLGVVCCRVRALAGRRGASATLEVLAHCVSTASLL